VRGGGKRLAHVAAVDRGLEAVDDPACRQPLDALLQRAGHLELELPLVHARIDLVGLVLGAIDGEQGKRVLQNGLLIRYGLWGDRVGGVPADKAVSTKDSGPSVC